MSGVSIPDSHLSSTPVKPRKVSGYEVSQPNAEHNRTYLVEEKRCQWIGPMPIQSFVDTFLPPVETCPPVPTVPKQAFHTGKRYKKEKDMYQPFIDIVETYDIIPGFKLVDSFKGREIKPDPTLYKVDVNTETRKIQWDKVEMNLEFKIDDSDDPFCDPDQPISDLTEEQRQHTPFLADSANRKACLGQLANYAAEWMGRQHRCFAFTMFIADPYVHFIRWDRAGAVVSQRFNFREDCGLLVQLLWRFTHTDDGQRGLDITVRDPNEEEMQLARSLLDGYKKPKNRPIKVFAVPCRDKGKGKDWYQFIGWHPMVEPWSLTGRCTRAYPVVEFTTRKIMFLKDVWRAVDLEKESEILKELKKKDIPHVPGLVCGDDIDGHLTMTDRFVPGGDSSDDTSKNDTFWVLGESWSKIIPRIHNRLVVDVVCRPLEGYTSSKEMFRAVYHAFTAHKQAYLKCNIIHRDISMGNIMITHEGNGVLIDWDLARKTGDLQSHRKHERTGTWAFMSIQLLRRHAKLHTIQDDMESFFYVILYAALRYSSHTMQLELRSILEELFEYAVQTYDGRSRGGMGKHLFFLSGSPLERFALLDNEPLTNWLWQVKEWFNEWVTVAQNPQKRKDGPLVLDDYSALEKSFVEALQEEGWPEDDAAKDGLRNISGPTLHFPHQDKARARRAKRSFTSSTGEDSAGSVIKKGKM